MKKYITTITLLLTILLVNCNNEESKIIRTKENIATKKKPKTDKTPSKKDNCKEILYTTSSGGNKIYKDCKNNFYVYEEDGVKSPIEEWECGKYKGYTLVTGIHGACYYLDENFKMHHVGRDKCKECHK